ncbi:MAG: S8 family serine peptidase [Saprospiraceae bacterium]
MKTFFAILGLLFGQISFGQVMNNVIIFEYSGRDIENISHYLTENNRSEVDIELLGKNLNLYKIVVTNGNETLALLRNHKDVVSAQFDAVLEMRNTPNDPRVNQQYHHGLIGSYAAWEKTTGGTDGLNRELVVAVIDEGFYTGHEDLQDNIYTNPDEIPGDFIDNDGNGFVDDLHGWNLASNQSAHLIRSHGTGVISMIGAKGNNGLGISGMNWNIKILPLTTASTVSDVLRGYDYILGEKKAFNSSQGSKGANIIVSSYSGGLSHKFPSDQPTWCAVYDKLGEEGILSVSATSNENENVEQVGDIPTLCTSPYLLTVSSTNRNDTRTESSGFGQISVDVSAPGEEILLADTPSNGIYNYQSGTSFATPIVAGSAALIYSYECPVFQEYVANDPSQAALIVKNALISSVDKLSSLKNLTVSQGRINVNGALDYLSSNYNDCGSIFISKVYHDDVSTYFSLISSVDSELQAYITDSSGKIVMESKKVSVTKGNSTYPINFLPTSQGTYFLSLSMGKDVFSMAFPVIK